MMLGWSDKLAHNMNTDVLILGAGAAGLAAAKTLTEAGIPNIILEAQARIGGRVHTRYDFAGIPVELGAEFIHGQGSSIYALAQTYSGDPLPIDRYHHLWWGIPAQPWSHLPANQRLRIEAALGVWEDLGQDLQDPDGSLLEFLLARGWDPDHLDIADALLAQPCCGSLSTLSCHDWIRENQVDTAGKHEFRLPAGYSTLLKHYAQGLDIRLKTPVDTLHWRCDKSPLAPTQGIQAWSGSQSFTAHRAIITLPVALLQKGSLAFSPPLSPAKQAAIAAFRVEPATKLLYRFAPPAPWQDPQALFAHTGLFSRWWIPPSNRDPVIICFITGDRARNLDRLPESEALSLGLQALAQMLDQPHTALQAQCLAAQRVSWGQDPWALGGYAHLPPGSAAARPALARSEAGILFFAGEATAFHSNPQTVHGALDSGIHAALACAQTLI